MRRAVLIYNPTSGRVRPRTVPEVLGLLRGHGFDVEPRPTRRAGDASTLARQAADDGVEVAFALGGDGTMREAAAGLLGSEVALGPLPAGTANVLARALGLPRDPRAAARRISEAAALSIDVGRIDGEPFLMMASGGLDAAVVAHQNATLKKLLGRAAFGWSMLAEWWSYDFPEIVVRVGGEEDRATLVAACNIPFYGGGFRMAPAADFRDRRLDLVLFRGRGRAAALAFTRDVLAGRHLERDDVEVRRVEGLEVLGPGSVRFQVDGDVVSRRPPFAIDLAPERLRVLA